MMSGRRFNAMDSAHKNIIRRNRVAFVQDMHLDVVLDYLIQEGIINEAIRQQLMLPNHTEMRRNGELIDTLPKRGPKAFDVFYDGLKSTEQYHLADLLKPELAPSEQHVEGTPTSGITQPSSRDSGSIYDRQLSNPVQPSDATDTRLNIDAIPVGQWPKEELLQINVRPTSHHMLQRLRAQARNFKMIAKPRGRAVIINNEKFEGKLPERTGTNVDAYNLQVLFEQLHFTLVTHRNKKAHQIKEILAKEKDNESHKSADCFVLVVLSHGEDEAIYGTDEKLVTYKDLYRQFDGSNCSSLRGKPKLFFIQACQGIQLERSVDACDGFPSELVQAEQRMKALGIAETGDRMDANPFTNSEDTYLSKQDILMSTATFPEHLSWRNEDYGSWFIRAICEVFQDYACEDDLIELLRKVRNLVAKRKHVEGHRQMTSEKLSTLTKRLYFCPETRD